MKNNADNAAAPARLKSIPAEAIAAKTTEAQAARLAADITAREAAAAEKRARGAKIRFKSAKKAWKQARRAAKRSAKRAKQAREQLTALSKNLKPTKKKAAAKPLIRRSKQNVKPVAKKKIVKRKRFTSEIGSGPAPIPKAPDSPTSPLPTADSSVA